MKIIKENGNIHLEVTNKNETIKFSLFNHNGTYELLAHRTSHSIFNFVKIEVNKDDEIQILNDWFKLVSDTLIINKIDCIPFLVDDTIEDKL